MLEVRDIRLTYPGNPPAEILRGVSFSIAPGEILGLVGESGCGKSTVARIIMQLQRPTAGRVLLGGRDLTALRGKALRQSRRDYQMVFQDPRASLNPRMAVGKMLGEAVLAARPKLSREELSLEVNRVLEKCGMDPDCVERYPHEFSGGQCQRLAIARALATQPRLLVADEPVSALDVSVQAQILNLLAQLVREEALTMLFITHDLAVVRYLAHRIAVMRRGELLEIASTERVFSEPAHEYTRHLLSARL